MTVTVRHSLLPPQKVCVDQYRCHPPPSLTLARASRRQWRGPDQPQQVRRACLVPPRGQRLSVAATAPAGIYAPADARIPVCLVLDVRLAVSQSGVQADPTMAGHMCCERCQQPILLGACASLARLFTVNVALCACCDRVDSATQRLVLPRAALPLLRTVSRRHACPPRVPCPGVRCGLDAAAAARWRI